MSARSVIAAVVVGIGLDASSPCSSCAIHPHQLPTARVPTPFSATLTEMTLAVESTSVTVTSQRNNPSPSSTILDDADVAAPVMCTHPLFSVGDIEPSVIRVRTVPTARRGQPHPVMTTALVGE
jgi:hypothetical protein